MDGLTDAYAALQGHSGFAGSEHAGLRARIYRRGDAIAGVPATPINLNRDGLHIVAGNVSNALGQGAMWQLTVRVEPTAEVDLTQEITDDDWIDIEAGRGDVWWHLIRGMVDEVRRATNVADGGVTSVTYTISGQSFQKVWTSTPMWFSATRAENIGGQKFQGIEGTGLDVPGTVSSFLFDYTNAVAQRERSSVALPPGMPAANADFSSTWRLDQAAFDDDWNPRINLLKNSLAPSSNVWDVATGWADPYFCECFTEILPAVAQKALDRKPDVTGRVQMGNAASAYGKLPQGQSLLPRGLSIADSSMTLVVRNKPFISLTRDTGHGPLELGFSSPWFDLPMQTVPRQHVSNLEIGRNGHDRYNAFFSAALLTDSGSSMSTRQLSLPLWNESDMRQHGMRIMDCVSNYEPDILRVDSNTYLQRLRAQLRDWYCWDAYAYSGTIALARSYPELRVGVRLRLLGNHHDKQMTFYVESVAHTFAAGAGMRTSVGVTRGYRGTDAEHLALLAKLVAQYTEPAG